jgi:hypothetical protein
MELFLNGNWIKIVLNKMKNKLNILNEFSEYPKLRYCTLSETSAEKFYHELLNERFGNAVIEKTDLEVNIDYTAGYTSSFLDEAFGNLVFDFGLETVNKHLVIISNDEPYWLDMIKSETFKEWQKRRKENNAPKKTKSHLPWYRFVDNTLGKKIWIEHV